jgi:ferredoxin-like protein FixX
MCYLLHSDAHTAIAHRLLEREPALIETIYEGPVYHGENALHMAVANSDMAEARFLARRCPRLLYGLAGEKAAVLSQERGGNEGRLCEVVCDCEMRAQLLHSPLRSADGIFFSKDGFGQDGHAYYGELPLSFGERPPAVCTTKPRWLTRHPPCPHCILLSPLIPTFAAICTNQPEARWMCLWQGVGV